MSSLPKPVDLSIKSSMASADLDAGDFSLAAATTCMPLPMTAPSSLNVVSSMFQPSFDSFNAAGQPILDLHSALNNIHKSFTIGSRTNTLNKLVNMSIAQPPSPPLPLPMWSSLGPSMSTSLGPPPPPMSPLNYAFTPSVVCEAGSETPMKALNLTSVTPPTVSTNHSQAAVALSHSQMSKYNQLLEVLEEMNKDVRPSYAGSKSSVERLKRGIAHARILVREALIEAERSSRN